MGDFGKTSTSPLSDFYPAELVNWSSFHTTSTGPSFSILSAPSIANRGFWSNLHHAFSLFPVLSVSLSAYFSIALPLCSSLPFFVIFSPRVSFPVGVR